jgi:5'-phosphate synthase pdxT subunit
MGYQGGSDLHIKALKQLNIPVKKIFKKEDFKDIAGLIMPGGESSVQYKYCHTYGIKDAIIDFVATGKPIFGTCAGAILLSNYKSEKVNGFGLLDIDVERNTYGRQINSGKYISYSGEEVLFIRAPGIINIGEKVEILNSYEGRPILVKQDNIYAATFHPECLNIDHNNLLYKIFG